MKDKKIVIHGPHGTKLSPNYPPIPPIGDGSPKRDENYDTVMIMPHQPLDEIAANLADLLTGSNFVVSVEELPQFNYEMGIRITKCETRGEDSALDVQVGGGHYKDMAIQPIEFTHKNKLNFCQGNIIKYATRYKAKNGKEDLEKVKHYADLLIELEGYNE
jgi:hypothetical protein